MFSGRPGAHHHWSQSIYVSDLMAKVLSDLKLRMITCYERSQTNILESGTACERYSSSNLAFIDLYRALANGL